MSIRSIQAFLSVGFPEMAASAPGREYALTENERRLLPRWKLVQQPAAGLIVPRLSFTPFFILPTTCISQALQSNLRINFSLPLISVIGSGFRCFTSFGHKFKL